MQVVHSQAKANQASVNQLLYTSMYNPTTLSYTCSGHAWIFLVIKVLKLIVYIIFFLKMYFEICSLVIPLNCFSF